MLDTFIGGLQAVGLVGVLVAPVVAAIMMAILYRRVVPTNMVHILQSAKSTVAYGKGKDAGNVYYAWPSWVPRFGVTVLEFPESIFSVKLAAYDAYDQARLPFVVDSVAFFRIEETALAAQRVANFHELEQQLLAVLQGAVRRVLATNTLEKIMESRSELGEQFTAEVNTQIEEWGVTTVKTIEFMDLRDADGSEVIKNIMAKEKSRIDKESRVAVALNKQAAQLAEIDAQRTVDVQRQEAEQLVGLRTAEKEKIVGIANEQASQEVQEQTKVTTQKAMDVEAVRREREAEIALNVSVTNAEAARKVSVTNAEAAKEVAVTNAEANKQSAIHIAEGKLQETLKAAEGIAAQGAAEASAQEKILMAPVTAQITLAKEIGENPGYQTYLVTLEQVKASQVVGEKMAEALGHAELKVISTGGSDNVMGGVAKLTDVFTPVGGTKLSGMLAALAATDEGKAVVAGLAQRLGGAEASASAMAPGWPGSGA